jgi:hypothetical protein
MITITITVDAIMAHDPCDDYPRERVESLVGECPTVRAWADREDIPIEDRLWVLWRVLPDTITKPCAVQAVTRALNLPAVVEYASKNAKYAKWRSAWLDGTDRSAEAWAEEAWAAATAAQAGAAEAAQAGAAEAAWAACDKERHAQLADIMAAAEEQS